MFALSVIVLVGIAGAAVVSKTMTNLQAAYNGGSNARWKEGLLCVQSFRDTSETEDKANCVDSTYETIQ